MAQLIEAIGAERASILVLHHETGELTMLAALGLPADALLTSTRPQSRSIADWVLRERKSLVLDGVVNSQSFETSARDDRIRSALSVPLLGSTGPIGVLNIARLEPATPFTDGDRVLVEMLACPISAAIERIQRTLLAHEHFGQLVAATSGPASTLVPFGGSELLHYEMAFHHRSSRRIGADLCDRVPHANGGNTFILVDVGGFGPLASTTAALLQGLFVAHASNDRSVSDLMSRIAIELVPRIEHRPPVSAWVAHMSPTGRVTHCGAGITAPFWVPSDGSAVIRLEGGGLPLGGPARPRYREETVQLLPGDLVVAVSHGLIAAHDPHGIEFGAERLCELALSIRRRPLEHVTELLCQAALSHSRRPLPLEDLTVLALRFMPRQ